MIRISGVDLPNERKITFGLTVIYGIGESLAKKVVEQAKVDTNKRVKDLTEEEVARLQKIIDKHPIEGELRRIVTTSIKRLEEIGSYRGLRHKRGLPARGQRTRSNARTKRGKRQTIGAIRKDMRAQAATKAQKEST